METPKDLNAVSIHLVVQTLKENLLTNSQSLPCMFDRIYTAGCYANLAYAFSQLHPDSIDSIKNKDTYNLIHIYQDAVIDVYDDATNPTVGAVILPLEKEVIIAFHGTNFSRKDDHITNFESKLVKSPYAPGLYHSGFLRLFNGIIPQIIKTLHQQYNNLDSDPPKVQIYGHSMGAGLAQILTQYMQYHYNGLDIETIVFGSPKVMCPIAADAYNIKNHNKTMRVENPLDLAIYMPTQFMGYGVVNNAILLPNTSTDMMRNHCIEGYLDSITTLRQQFRDQGIISVAFSDYIAATAKFNPIHPWMPHTSHRSKISPLSEFIQLIGQGLSQGIQAIIKALPFK
jgi:hypothetical protein